MRKVLFSLLWILPVMAIGQSNRKGVTAIFLEDIPWTQAEKILTPETVVAIPLGAAAKEHGPHLPLNADYLQVEFLKNEIAKTERVVIAPTITYYYYPPFINFPGSTTIRHSAAVNMVTDICRTLAAYGPKRFYVINYGISTNAPLKAAAAQLAGEGILLSYTNLLGPEITALNKSVLQEKEGTHAEEAETSTMLYMYPRKVDMRQAKQEYGKRTGPGVFVRDSTQMGLYVPSGIYGDATLATKAKGQKITSHLLGVIRKDIDSLRTAVLPSIIPVDGTPYIGEYETDDKRTIAITMEQGVIICQWNNRAKARMYAEGNDYFSSTMFETWFMRNDASLVTAVRLRLATGEVLNGRKK